MTKKLIAKFSPANNCFAKEGEVLIVAPPDHKQNMFRVDKDGWYFIGTESWLPSQFGWIKNVQPHETEDIEIPENKDFYSEMLRVFYNAINLYEENIPIACHWLDVGTINQKRILRVHKVVLYNVNAQNQE